MSSGFGTILTAVAWIVGATSLFGGIVLVVVAFVQLATGSLGGAAAYALYAAACFLVYVLCDHRIKAARDAQRRHEDRALEPVPVPSGGFVLRMRWIKWACGVSVFAGLALVGIAAGIGNWRDGEPDGVLVCALLTAAMLVGVLGLARFGLAAERIGAVARMDADGVQHCLLPALPWSAVRGLELRRKGGSRGTYWALVLALDPDTAARLALPAWRAVVDWCVPRVTDRRHGLELPLAFVRGDPREVAGMALTLAGRHCDSLLLDGWRKWR